MQVFAYEKQRLPWFVNSVNAAKVHIAGGSTSHSRS